jgi:hypothetical protein
MQNEKPSNTREQCAFDRGAQMARSGNVPAIKRDQHNPHKRGSAEHKFWNEGFDSV